MVSFIAGGTGLVGNELLKILLAKPGAVYALGRTPPRNVAGNIHFVAWNFEMPNPAERLTATCDIGYCTLGTTIKKAGSQEKFKKVDHDFILNFARLCKAQGAKTFVVVSSLGANPKSSVFYNRIKGESEQSLINIGFDNLIILRPSLLLGDRTEFRPAEKFARHASALIAPLLDSAWIRDSKFLSLLKKVQAVSAKKVAECMASFAKLSETNAVPSILIVPNERIGQ